MQFYSAKAYEYVRKTFNLALPYQAQIQKWYSKVPAEPGLTEPAFTAIMSRVDAAKIKDEKVLLSAMLDEKSIKTYS